MNHSVLLRGGERTMSLRHRSPLFFCAGTGLALMLSSCVAPSKPPPEFRVTTQTAPPPVRPPAPVRPFTASRTPSPAMVSVIRSLVRDYDGTVGVAVRRAGAEWVIAEGADRPLPQQSVSKLWVALALMDQVDRRLRTLDDPVLITRSDLTVFHQPLAARVKDSGYTTTLRELLTLAMTKSDNLANDSILRVIGGPDAVRATLMNKGLDGIRFGPGERLLQAGTAGLTWRQDMSLGRRFYEERDRLSPEQRRTALDRYFEDPVDGATPSGISNALLRLVQGDLLSPGSTQTLMGLMSDSTTGKRRLRAGVPDGWRFGHKTGTGQDLGSRTVGYNDVGYLIAPDGTAYTVAVMIGSTQRPVPDRMALMQNVATAVTLNHTP